MIVVVKTGTSFKGAHAYLSHDKAEAGGPHPTTRDRVAWTHTLNLLENEPDEAVREMQKTCFDAPMLKMMSGNRSDGRPCAKPVMTVSLSWAQDQHPDRPQMIAAAQGYLKSMGWEGLQAQLYAHNDTAHAHLHLLVNRIHPETGMAADKAWVTHRSHQWALGYEREQGQVLCPARVGKFEDGQRTPNAGTTRAEWETWQGLDRQAQAADRAAALKSGEWDSLKTALRDERLAFLQESGQMRRALRTEAVRTVKHEFADDWAFYAETRTRREAYQREQDAQTRRGIRYLRRHGGGHGEGIERLEAARAAQHAQMRAALAQARQPILDAQRARLAVVTAEALAGLNAARAVAYKELLATQRGEKAELRTDQAAGIQRPDLVDRQHDAADRLAAARGMAPPPAARLETGRTGNQPSAAHGSASPEIHRAQAPSPAPERDTRPPPPAEVDRPRIDMAARVAALRALSQQRSAERGRGKEDGGRDRDR